MSSSNETSSLTSMLSTTSTSPPTTATTTTTTTTTTISTTTATTYLIAKNETIFNLIAKLLNGSDLYKHQVADLIEPEKYSVTGVHIIIWTFCLLTYILAIPIAIRFIRSRAYLNPNDYFSLHIIFCAFIAWIPSLILILYYWFNVFTVRLCRLHYVILSANETVPFFFVLYMIIERFLYAHPAYKQKFKHFSRMSFIHLYAIFTWLLIMLIYAFASPFKQPKTTSTLLNYTAKYCPYDYSKLESIATARSIIYFFFFIPALILIGFILRYFYLLRGTSQVPPTEKLWTIRVTSLLCILVFYDIYLFYLEHVNETYRSFLLASMLRSTFFFMQLIVIIWTEPYWIEFLLERCACLCCLFTGGPRRKATTPVAMTTETEFSTMPYSSATAGHYSLVDDMVDDEFDRVPTGPQPTLRLSITCRFYSLTICGIIFCLLGISGIVLSAIELFYGRPSEYHYDTRRGGLQIENPLWPSAGKGIWIGLILIATGLVGILASRERTPPALMGFTALTGVSTILSFYLMITSIIPIQYDTKYSDDTRPTWQTVELVTNSLLIAVGGLSSLLGTVATLSGIFFSQICTDQRPNSGFTSDDVEKISIVPAERYRYGFPNMES
ncbi:hypothetical protein I4U23_006310 [Adineta vaga]|nr:hypothetical protein I4U23_006310 [Adineta vaga]